MTRGALVGLSVLAVMVAVQPGEARPRGVETDYSVVRELTPSERQQGEALIVTVGRQFAQEAREPGSLQFRRVALRSNADPHTGQIRIQVVGETNGKNGYGGFTGWVTFMGTPGHVDIGENFGRDGRGWYDARDYTAEMIAAAGAASSGSR